MAITTNQNANRSIAVACVVFFIIAGWYASGIISDMSSFNDWDKPKEVGQIMKGCAFAGVGALLALGVNIIDILRPILQYIPGLPNIPAAPPSEAPTNSVPPDPPKVP